MPGLRGLGTSAPEVQCRTWILRAQGMYSLGFQAYGVRALVRTKRVQDVDADF